MVAGLGRQQLQIAAIELHPIQMTVVGVLSGLASAGGEVNVAFAFVDALNIAHEPVALRDGVLELSVAAMAVQMAPALTLGKPDDIAAAQDADARRSDVIGGGEE